MQKISYEQELSKLEQQLSLLNQGLITSKKFINNITEEQISILTTVSFQDGYDNEVVTIGKVLSNGIAVGKICYSLEEVLDNFSRRTPAILVTDKINNDMLCEFNKLDGVITCAEDLSSHAIIVAKVSNVPVINVNDFECFNNLSFVSLDAYNGYVICGEVAKVYPNINHPVINEIIQILESNSSIKVNANADNADGVELGKYFGANGFEPRTEHMILKKSALQDFRALLLSNGLLGDKKNQIMQSVNNFLTEEIYKIYQMSANSRVLIRLFDPPIHEFLPESKSDLECLSTMLELSMDELNYKMSQVYEVNPMSGLRGARLLIMNSDILYAQIKAIFKAATMSNVIPYITIPMVIEYNEVVVIKQMIDKIKNEIYLTDGVNISYKLGIMIETPISILTGSKFATLVDYISLGTNDLTAQSFAFSRGDVYDKNHIQSRHSFPMFIKPTSLAGSEGTSKILNSEQLMNYFDKASANIPYEIDEYIDGELYHCDVAILNKSICYSFVNKYLCPLHEFKNGKIIGGYLLNNNDTLAKEMINQTELIINKLGIYNGVYHAEFFVRQTPNSDDEIIFIEIAARPGGAMVVDMIEESYGVNLHHIHFALQLNQSYTVKPVFKQFGMWAWVPPKCGTFIGFNFPPFKSEIKLVEKVKCGDVIAEPETVLNVIAGILFLSKDIEDVNHDYNLLTSPNAVESMVLVK